MGLKRSDCARASRGIDRTGKSNQIGSSKRAPALPEYEECAEITSLCHFSNRVLEYGYVEGDRWQFGPADCHACSGTPGRVCRNENFFKRLAPIMGLMDRANGLPRAGFLLLGLGLTLVAGCGEKSPYTVVPVSGKVTYDDGTPIPGTDIQIVFVPQAQPINPKEYPRRAYGTVSRSDGRFDQMTTNQFGDGVTVGPQKVMVISLNEQGKPSGAVPAQYADPVETPLTADVTSGGSPYAFQVAKPTK